MDDLPQIANQMWRRFIGEHKIGPGFKIEHLSGIVVNPDVVIGKNCNIYITV